MKNFNFLKRVLWLLIPLLTLFNVSVWGQSGTHTSNVTLTAGTNGSACTISFGGNSYSGIKMGTGKLTGSMSFDVPAGITTVYIHVARWNGDNGNLSITRSAGTVSPSSITDLTSDAGISGTGSSFTLNDPTKVTTSYFYTLTLSSRASATTITLSTTAKRAVVWGVNTASSCTEISPTLTYSTDSIGIGGTATVSTLNKDGSSGSVTYTISPASGVASINSETGEVTGTGTGTATVTATIAAAGGKCSGSATATIKVRRAINYYIGSTAYTKGGVDGATLLSVLPASPSSCDAVNYPYFYGWKAGSISGVATGAPSILSTETVSSSSAANTYYAVFTDALDYSTTHTSNVNISSNATAVIGGSNYDAKKLGSNGSGGSFTITVPSGTTKLYLHAAGWNNKSSSLTLSTNVGSISPNTAQNLTSNSGVANSTPFTLATPITNAFFEYTLSNINSAATITITANSERALVWGVNSATSAGGSGNYITNCCTPLGTINGSYKWSKELEDIESPNSFNIYLVYFSMSKSNSVTFYSV